MFSNVTYKFDGKRALVTGAGSGIGRGVALALAHAGAVTYALDIDKDGLDSLASEHSLIRPLCVSVRDVPATRKAVEQALPIDLLVNNVGVTKVEKFVDCSLEDLDLMMDINVKAAIVIGQIVVKDLISRNQPGSIVNISSLSSVRSLMEHTNYSASKSALDMITKTMALELGQHQIRVNSIHPTVVMTNMGRQVWHEEAKAGPMKARIPVGRFAEVPDIVGPILFLLSDAASMVHGHLMLVDGGYTVA